MHTCELQHVACKTQHILQLPPYSAITAEGRAITAATQAHLPLIWLLDQ